MSGRISETGHLICEAIQRFPNADVASLCRYLVAKYPHVFLSFESARGSVRHWRKKLLVRQSAKRKTLAETVPESAEQSWQPYVFKPDSSKGLVISDLHMPYHDKRAVQVALEHARKCGATDFLLINGDAVDCYHLSCYTRDPLAIDFVREIETLKQFLEAMAVDMGYKHIIYKLGNHEARLVRYLRIKAPELWGVPTFSWQSILGDEMKRLGVQVVDHDVPVYIGKLTIIHGHEIAARSTPVNPARTLFLKMKDCALAGHWHRQSTHTEVTSRGSVVTTWSTGCLCQLHPEYCRISGWSHGVAHLTVNGDDFCVETYRILPDGSIRTT